jgi:hypothetical protein
MIDDKLFTNTGRTSREKVLDRMRPGDMHRHLYNDRQIEVIDVSSVSQEHPDGKSH